MWKRKLGAEAVERVNFYRSGSYKRKNGTASAIILAIHIELQKLKCGTIFCEIFAKMGMFY